MKAAKQQVVLGSFASILYRILEETPCSTAGEALSIYKQLYPSSQKSRNDLASVLNQMRKKGVITKVGVAMCNYSGVKATTWSALPSSGLILSDEDPSEKADFVETSSEDFDSVPTSGCDCDLCRVEQEELQDDECDCEDCCCAEEDEEDEEEEIYDERTELSLQEKASLVEELTGERCVAPSQEDIAILRDLANAVDQLDTNPLAKMIVNSIPGLKGKAEQLKKALKYFR